MSTKTRNTRQMTSLVLSVLLIATSINVHAENKHHKPRNHHTDYARVTNVDPVYKTVSHRIPEQSCWIETSYEPVYRGHQPGTPMILGTLIGGAIGNKLGHSNTNKKVGAVAGAILGGSIASDINHKNNNHTVAHDQEVCDTVYRTEYEELLVGYDVSYRYHDRHYTSRMNEHPGKRIKVEVAVRPVYY